ncbi:GP46-like surface antigen, putative, partial [Bodo saltans]
MQALHAILLLLTIVTTCVAGSMCGCESSLPVLMDFYSSTNGPLWTESSGWGSTNCSLSWFGVACSEGSIVEIRLPSNNLTGMLIEALGNLTQLTLLDLSYNQLTGSLPSTWASMSFVTVTLSYNRIGGSLPVSWSQLAAIKVLILDHNDLCGPLPDSWSSMKGITTLILDSNPINATLPESWSGMGMIDVLCMDNCSLYGTLPSSWRFDSIEQLFLNNNALSGTMPLDWKYMGGSDEFSYANISNNCLLGTVPWANLNSGDSLQVLDTCGTHLDLETGNCTRLPTAWPAYCSSHTLTNDLATKSRSMTDLTSKHYSTERSQDYSTSDSDATLSALSQTTLGTVKTVFTSTLTPTVSMSPALIPAMIGTVTTRSVLAAAASAPLAATALLSAFSGVDPGSAQALLTVLRSPCFISDTHDHQATGEHSTQDSVMPSASSIALSPLVLFGDEGTIGAFEVAIGNAGLAMAFFFVHAALTLLHNRHNYEKSSYEEPAWICSRRAIQHLACSKSAAVLRFPSLSINFALYLTPGVAWAVSTLMSSTTTSVVQIVAGSVVGIGWIACFGVLLNAVVLHCWILDSEFGLTFRDFLDVQPFSPPVPRSVAAVICSRRGQWGPSGRRSAFGSPIATSFFPEHMRWMWAVSPLMSLLAVSLNTARPPQAARTVACDAIQSILMVCFLAVAVLFGSLRPHRSILRSFLSCFSAAHNALVTLLGMLARYQRISQDAVLVVAAVGSYTSMLLGIVVVCIGFLEQRLLPRQVNDATEQLWSIPKVNIAHEGVEH